MKAENRPTRLMFWLAQCWVRLTASRGLHPFFFCLLTGQVFVVICGFYQCLKDVAGGFVLFCRAFRVPLDCQHKMIWGRAFEGFDDAVGGAASCDAESLADGVGGLVVGGVYREQDIASLRGQSPITFE
jgi:hypothetical protein